MFSSCKIIFICVFFPLIMAPSWNWWYWYFLIVFPSDVPFVIFLRLIQSVFPNFQIFIHWVCLIIDRITFNYYDLVNSGFFYLKNVMSLYDPCNILCMLFNKVLITMIISWFLYMCLLNSSVSWYFHKIIVWYLLTIFSFYCFVLNFQSTLYNFDRHLILQLIYPVMLHILVPIFVRQ